MSEIHIYCAKCKHGVQNVLTRHDPHRQILQVQFTCHGTTEVAIIPVMELQQMRNLVVFGESVNVKQ